MKAWARGYGRRVGANTSDEDEGLLCTLFVPILPGMEKKESKMVPLIFSINSQSPVDNVLDLVLHIVNFSSPPPPPSFTTLHFSLLSCSSFILPQWHCFQSPTPIELIIGFCRFKNCPFLPPRPYTRTSHDINVLLQQFKNLSGFTTLPTNKQKELCRVMEYCTVDPLVPVGGGLQSCQELSRPE